MPARVLWKITRPIRSPTAMRFCCARRTSPKPAHEPAPKFLDGPRGCLSPDPGLDSASRIRRFASLGAVDRRPLPSRTAAGGRSILGLWPSSLASGGIFALEGLSRPLRSFRGRQRVSVRPGGFERAERAWRAAEHDSDVL